MKRALDRAQRFGRWLKKFLLQLIAAIGVLISCERASTELLNAVVTVYKLFHK